MYHPPSPKKQLIQRVTVYSIMSLAVVALVSVLVFFMLGYQFNKTDGRIAQGGLVQFESRPNGATVAIDGTNFGTRTTAKTTMSAGQHFVTMKRAGYRTWQKSIDVVPGSVLWLNYARLIPTTLTPTSVADYAAVSSTSASLSKRWLAIHGEASSPIIHLADISRDPAVITDLTLPEDSYTKPAEGKTQSFSLDVWGPSNRYLLVKHTYDDTKVEWLVVDTQNVSATKNISTLLGVDVSQVMFDPDDNSVLFGLVDSTVRRIDLGSETLSGPIASNVAEFELYDGAVVYTTLLDPETKMRSVGYVSEGSNKAHTLRSYSDSGAAPLHIAINQYFEEFYVAIAYDKQVEIMKGELPDSDSADIASLDAVATLSLPNGVDYLSIVTNGRFVVAQSTTDYVVYDIELKKTTKTALKHTTPLTQELKWLDSYTIWSDQEQMLRLYEFDGANQHDIMPVASGLTPTLSPNGKFLYGVATTDDGGFQLRRVQLVL